MEQRILLINEVAALLRVANSSIYRWVAERRKGIGKFPLPISTQGGKLRWLASDVETYLASQSQISPNLPTARQRQRNAKAFQERQNATDMALSRYKGKGATNG